jgi:ATP/maltotriose-dependent transcriptional regulator MalT/two-component SAPR family response regulator
MHNFLDQSVTIVSANAGSGKTTLVADFVHSSSLPFIWYQLDPSDIDVGVFFGYLVFGIRRSCPDFGQATLGFIAETEALSSKVQQLTDIFINEVGEQIEQKTLIVLDDFHHIEGLEEISTAVDRLLLYLPDVLHVIIISRSIPNLSISRLKSKGMLGLIDRKDLLFTPTEVEKLFLETFGRPLPPDMIDRFYMKTEGWVTALQLIQQSFEQHGDNNSHAHPVENAYVALKQSEMDLFDYFAEEVFRMESPENRQMLSRVSLLEPVAPVICETVLGITDCRERLRTLARRNVFITHVFAPGIDEEYRLHPLFRNFLNRCLVSEIGSEEIRRLHRMCGDYLSSMSRWDIAVHHYTEAGAAEKVADLIAARGAELVRAGRFGVIKRAFEKLLPETLNDRPHALIARADVALTEGDRPLALSLYESASQKARETGNNLAEAEALRGQAYIARYKGDYERAVGLANRALELAKEENLLRAKCFNIVGLCRFIPLNDPAGAIESWRSALEEAHKAGDDRFARIVLHNLGLPYFLEGDLNEALRWISQMLEPRRDNAEPGLAPEKTTPFPQEAIAHLNIARLQINLGRFDEAQSHLEIALERCRMFNLLGTRAETLEAMGSLYRERGDYSRALNFLNEAARAYREAGVALTDREFLDERATLYLEMGEIDLAERESKEDYNARGNRTPMERATTLITCGRIEVASGRYEAAETALLEAAEISRSNNHNYNECRALTSLARLMSKINRTQEAIDLLRRAVQLSIQYDYSYWLRSEATRDPHIFRAAVESNIAVDYLSPLLPDKIAEQNQSARGEKVSAQKAPSRAESLADSTIYDLAVDMLGPVKVYRHPAEPMPEDTWKLAKSLHILCYIASRRNLRAPKETLVELFWPDSDSDTVSKNFHPTISHLRKALNREQIVKKDFILYREGAYFLNPQYRYRIDIQEFERKLAEAREARHNGDSEAAAQLTAQAVELYRGALLEELYFEWAAEMQSYYSDLYLEALKELLVHYLGQNDEEAAIRFGQMILQHDPYREDVHCQVMEAYVRSGNRAAAIDQFDRLRKMLRKELGVDPLPATIAKYESLIK